jgi:superfamily II DNA or RNA helicase
MVDYSWQTECFKKWDSVNRRGVIKAVPGAGKTIAGIRLIQNVLQENPDYKILIVAPTKTIINQWKEELKKFNITNIPSTTYFSALKILSTTNIDVLILDECHSVLSEKRGKVLDYNIPMILGLSATPENSVKLIGPIFLEIGWDEANLAPFSLEYITFDMDLAEQEKYQRFTDEVKDSIRKFNEGYIDERQKMIVIMKRRSYVYQLNKRIDIAFNLIKLNYGKKIMVFCERLEQLRTLSSFLKLNGYSHSIYTSETDTIDSYRFGKTNILLSAKMIKEGFNDPDTEIGIIVSTPLSMRNQVQTIGRIIRFKEGKQAKIYWILANGTSDTDLIDKSGLPNTVKTNYEIVKKIMDMKKQVEEVTVKDLFG